MTPENIRDYLHRLQRTYSWPNEYFAWKKSDNTYFMLGTRSGQMNHIMLYEYHPFYKEYNAHLYNISPNMVHMRGPHVFDPVEELAQKVEAYQYLGCWTDQAKYIPDHHGQDVLAHGRWDLALKNITAKQIYPDLSATLAEAKCRTKTQKNPSKTTDRTLTK